MGGRHVFMGYLNDPANTAAAIDPEGFLCTGDVGQVDKRGLIFITGRLKVKRRNFLVVLFPFYIILFLDSAGDFDHGRWRECGPCFD